MVFSPHFVMVNPGILRSTPAAEKSDLLFPLVFFQSLCNVSRHRLLLSILLEIHTLCSLGPPGFMGCFLSFTKLAMIIVENVACLFSIFSFIIPQDTHHSCEIFSSNPACLLTSLSYFPSCCGPSVKSWLNSSDTASLWLYLISESSIVF